MILNFFIIFTFPKKRVGRAGDGKRNILWGWPNEEKKAYLESVILKDTLEKLSFTICYAGKWIKAMPEDEEAVRK